MVTITKVIADKYLAPTLVKWPEGLELNNRVSQGVAACRTLTLMNIEPKVTGGIAAAATTTTYIHTTNISTATEKLTSFLL